MPDVSAAQYALSQDGHQAATILELVEQCGWQNLHRAIDQNRFKGCFGWCARGERTFEDSCVADLQCSEQAVRSCSQFAVSLDRDDALGKLGQHRRGIACGAADIQHHRAVLDLCQLHEFRKRPRGQERAGSAVCRPER